MNKDNYELKDHIIRIYDVMVLGIVYFIFGMASSYAINKFSSSSTNTDSSIKLCLEICAEVSITVLFTYFIHIIIAKMPLPMIGTDETKKAIILEVRGGIVLAYAMFILQVKLRNKIQYLFYGQIDNYELINVGE